MKGLEYLGKIFKSYTKNTISRDLSKSIRSNINPKKMCSLCLSEYTHQNKLGDLLCEECYKEYNDDIKNGRESKA